MPAALISFLVQLLEPVIMQVLKKVYLSFDLHNLDNASAGIKAGYEALDKANTSDEIKASLALIAKSSVL